MKSVATALYTPPNQAEPIASPRGRKSVSDETLDLVKAFYLRDDVSRCSPGRRDFVKIGEIQFQKVGDIYLAI